MKAKPLFTLIFFFLLAGATFAQTKKRPDWMEDQIKPGDVYLQYLGKRFKLVTLTDKNIRVLLGNPLKKERAKSEISEQMYNTYTYTFGSITIEGGLSDLEFDKAGPAYVIKTKSGYSKPFAVGAGYADLKNLFPYSRRNMKDNHFIIYLENTECSISFDVDDSKIKKLSFFTNES